MDFRCGVPEASDTIFQPTTQPTIRVVLFGLRVVWQSRVVVCCCKTYPRSAVTAEVARASLVVPAVSSKRVPRISLNPSCPSSTSARPKARELALANVYTLLYIYSGGKSWPSLAYLSPGTAKL